MKTKKQKKNERLASLLDSIAGGKGKSEIAKQIRASDRKLEKSKRQQFNKG